MEKHLKYVSSVVSRFGPEPEEYPELDNWFSHVHHLACEGTLSASDLSTLRLSFGEAMSAKTLQGFVCVKPHGYAGDFEIIDRIYDGHVSPDPRFARWDHYFHAHAGPKAVRNRKTYFQKLLQKHTYEGAGALRRVLVVGSGPGRDIFEHFTNNSDSGARFECIDIDPRAIAHAQAVNVRFADRITFRQQNALRFRPSHRYDLIWAAGIFDYFSDRVFQMLLTKLTPALTDGGELVIGNFSTENPSRAYMEFGEWRLHHRSADALASLALGCGIAADAIRIGAEPEGVNLFLHIANVSDSIPTLPD
jgi:SAM-dependent methyltransferase